MRKIVGLDRSLIREPIANVLHATPMFVGEVASRGCYDSFSKSENKCVREYTGEVNDDLLELKESDLLYKLSHAYHHESVLEHINISFAIDDISRGVLQELARHRIGSSYSVRSTRYTMGMLLFAYCFSYIKDDVNIFYDWVKDNKVFIIKESDMLDILIGNLYSSISDVCENNMSQLMSLVTKEDFGTLEKCKDLEEAMIYFKPKKNCGDDFKFLVGDNWRVSLVMTMNLRALKNFLNLRDSGAAWYQISNLAKTMANSLDIEYLKLIKKGV